MTISYWQGQSKINFPNLKSDVLIVGGGFAGLAVAYWLTELSPSLSLTLIERHYCGSGASGRNAGFLTSGSASFYKSLTDKWGSHKAAEIQKYSKDSLDLLLNKILKISPSNKFEKASSLTLFQTLEEHSRWDSKNFAHDKFQFIWKSNRELPPQLQDKFECAYENENEYKVNPIELIEKMKNILISRKVQIVENVSAFKLTEQGIETDNNLFEAKKVVMALNGYFAEFNHLFRQIIMPKRAQMLAVEYQGDFDCPALHYDPADRVYWRKTIDSHLIIGGKRLLEEDLENNSCDMITPIIQQGLESYLQDKLKLKFKVLKRWSGVMGFTDNELPIVSKLDSKIESYMIGGFSGHGLGFGFKAALELVEIMCGHKTESLFSQYNKSSLIL